MANAIPNGVRFAGFEILRFLGAGGFGITYLVKDIKTEARYAMKEYFPEDIVERNGFSLVITQGEETRFSKGLDAFFNEAETLRKLPRIRGLTAVRGLFRRNGTAYVLMEFIDGTSLSDIILGYIKNQRDFPEALVRDFLASIGQALVVVHGAGLIHRDIKPDNIIVRQKDGQPILIDFGASRSTRTRGETGAYTPSFAALEQLPSKLRRSRGHFKEGAWTDIFSLAMVGYVMMTGQKAPSAEVRVGTMSDGRPDPYVPVAQLSGGRYSAELCNLIDFSCALEPLRRPATAREFLGGIGVKAVSQSIDTHLDLGRSSKSLRSKRNALVIGIFGLSIIGAVLLGISL